MVNYVDMWPVHFHVASLLDGDKLELRELKACSTLFGACATCPLLRSDLGLHPLRLKILSTNLIILLAIVFYPLHMMRVALSRVSFSILLKRTSSFSRRLPI
jgi:hypothetical protein